MIRDFILKHPNISGLGAGFLLFLVLFGVMWIARRW